MLMTAFLLVLLASPAYKPARLESGAAPGTPAPNVVGGGEVLLEISVEAAGHVGEVRTLRDTPPFTDLVRAAVRSWRFSAAHLGDRDVASQVLVAAVYRPPVLLNAPVPGEAPRDVAQAAETVPLPMALVPPLYPPDHMGDAVVLLEVEVGADGNVRATRVVGSGSDFDAAAAQAARQWRFRAARRGGAAVPGVAYAAFGFRQPVTPPGSLAPRR